MLKIEERGGLILRIFSLGTTMLILTKCSWNKPANIAASKVIWNGFNVFFLGNFVPGERLQAPGSLWLKIFSSESYLANFDQTLLEWSLGGPLPKLCPTTPTSEQNGRQAKNRKKGDEIFY